MALRRLPGVLDATVSPGTDTALVRYVPGLVDFKAVSAAIESTGYQAARPMEQEESVDEQTAAHRRVAPSSTTRWGYPWLRACSIHS